VTYRHYGNYISSLHESFRLHFSNFDLVHVTPHPVFAWLDRAYQGVFASMEMLGGMLVLRRVAASNVPAFKAKPEVYPSISHLDAVFTDVLLCAGNLHFI
jgi:hypothetical protein